MYNTTRLMAACFLSALVRVKPATGRVNKPTSGCVSAYKGTSAADLYCSPRLHVRGQHVGQREVGGRINHRGARQVLGASAFRSGLLAMHALLVLLQMGALLE